jgi:hypothetical protein
MVSEEEFNAIDESIEEITEEIVEADLFTRLWEYVETYKTEVLGVAGDVILFVILYIFKSLVSKADKSTREVVAAVREKVDATFNKQEGVVGVVNEMIDSYNELSRKYVDMKQSYDDYGKLEDDRNKLVGTLVAYTSAILEMMVAVYPNSKNLPQGVKDRVNLTYANCLKMVGDDEKLLEIVKSVREAVNVPNEEVAETTETEE